MFRLRTATARSATVPRPTALGRPLLRRANATSSTPPPRPQYPNGKHPYALPTGLERFEGLELPPISQRLKPLIPFFFWWTVITSLAIHIMWARKDGEADMGRSQGRESVLRRLIERFQNGEVVSDKEIRRELEMVGLRERTSLTADVTEELAELREVSWLEVFLGRKKGQELEDKSLARREEKGEITEDQAVEEWTKIVTEAAAAAEAPALDVLPTQRSGVAKRADSANVYL